ncbi:scabrous protein [Culex quinquefasciatus]|uniref:Scabrous protein n=1 Tax=Culex quinquefasciatus TaxID=7176 RepID=B0X0D1_CULQU|nr:scabrous protein [Culex quinquefasciatus]|eukprot:XP_001863103.1 scabrous protein [Culex quinquefasciatus]
MLGADIKVLREGSSPNKDRLTVQWLSQSISEIRSELAELQESSSNVSKDAQLRNQLTEDITGLRADFATLRLELESLRSRQDKTEVLVRELREEAVQSAQDIRRSWNRLHEKM